MEFASDIANENAVADGAPARAPFAQIIENWLDSERERLPLLVPVGLGSGISFWQVYGPANGTLFAILCIGLCGIGLSLRSWTRLSTVLIAGALLLLAGFCIISIKSAIFGATPLERPWIGRIAGKIESVEDVSARDIIRLRLWIGPSGHLPSTVRVNVEADQANPQLQPGAIIVAKVRLMPPPGPALPGGYDFARAAWFSGLGATGSVIGPVEIVQPPVTNDNFWNRSRNSLSSHIGSAMGPETGAVGSALLVGTRGGIAEDDAEALRDSGLAHLLSVSGLHVTAVVGGSFILVSALLSLWPWLALRIKVPLFAAAAAAVIAICYTLLTGAEVPTVRACIAALLILVAMAMGREALSLRLLAFGATFVLLFWPEALAGPSFQLSFAAVGTIVLLHQSKWMTDFRGRRDEGVFLRLGRTAASLLLTGLAIEIVLAPIALFHFHKTGVYGALANMVAIPVTTFFIMPVQMIALLMDSIREGFGAPFWLLASQGIKLILWLAHKVSNTAGAVLLLPEMPLWAFATAVFSALVIAIFNDRRRWFALLPLLAALGAMAVAPRPDLLVTSDGQHLAVIMEDGRLALLRPGAGDYVRSTLEETAAIRGNVHDLQTLPAARCNADSCVFQINSEKRRWNILALRSGFMIPSMELAAACRRSDIVVSSRWLPFSCKLRWLKIDRRLIEKAGGMALYLNEPRVEYVAKENAHLPWSAYSPERLQASAAQRRKQKAAEITPPLLQKHSVQTQ